MGSELHAWRDGRHVATFTRSRADTPAELHYDSSTAPSLSLSLVNGRRHARRAASFWLEGLLPENPHMRARLAARHGADASDVFSLLAAAGADLAGAISLLPTRRTPGDEDDTPRLVSQDQVRTSIEAIRAGHGPTDVVTGQRLSLAGAQDKFSLALVGENWFTPTASLPSTHIIKPATTRNHGLDQAERAALDLARDIGLEAARASLVEGAFTVERFDRTTTRTGPRRRHLEDLTQALGLPPGHKYGVTAKQVIALLQDHGGHELAHQFVEQLAFNTHLGNADAHAKNYSLFLDEPTPVLSPLYDTVPVAAFPTYDQKLAMKIAGARYAAELTPAHWAKLARTTGLDVERVVHDASTIAEQISHHAATHGLADVIPRSAMVDTRTAAQPHPTQPPSNHEAPDRETPSQETTGQETASPEGTPGQGSGGGMGEVWVEAHLRNGRPVAGYYRARPQRH